MILAPFAKEVVDQLDLSNETANVGCIAFNGHPETLHSLTDDRRSLLDAIRDFTGGGSTSISAALEAAGGDPTFAQEILLEGASPASRQTTSTPAPRPTSAKRRNRPPSRVCKNCCEQTVAG